jgi:thiol-disulfide isomerase/thioredoxin
MIRTISLSAAFILVALTRASAANVGDSAPALEPTEWLNTEPTTWNRLKGRAILIDNWATWCGPCVASIPHMNELHDKYQKQGLTIIGCTDEPSATVKPFITSKGMKYAIAIMGKNASPYKSDTIPHAWLIDPSGQVVWKGHPAGLKEADIEAALVKAVVPPALSLPKELSSVSKQVQEGKYGAALKSLEGHTTRPKTPDIGKAAKDAHEGLTAYGKKKVEMAEEAAKGGDYVTAQELLTSIEKGFKGSDLSTKAKETLDGWKKDDALKVELEAVGHVQKANALMEASQWAAAAASLQKVTKGKKFEGTKTRALAEKKLAIVQKKLG